MIFLRIEQLIGNMGFEMIRGLFIKICGAGTVHPNASTRRVVAC